MIPYTKTQKFLDSKLDIELLNKLIYNNQQEYIRIKLRFLKLLWETKDFNNTVRSSGIDYSTAHSYLNLYFTGGLKLIAKPITKQGKQKLSSTQKQELARIIIEDSPADYSFDRYIWTGEIICELIKQLFNVELKDSRIYEILDELGLSHQKAHRDYDNADKQKQTEFQDNLKKNLNSSKTWKKKDRK